MRIPQLAGRQSRFVSTGVLPASQTVAALVQRVHDELADQRDGALSQVYPALASADPNQFGIALVASTGESWEAGESRAAFTLMSVSKPFVFALVAQAVGVDVVRELVGANATGLPFNSIEAIERGDGGRTNPMVNAGAIATTSLVPGDDEAARWAFVSDGLSHFAGRRLDLDEATLASARATNRRNRALAALLAAEGALVGDPDQAVDRYTRQCCVQVSAHDLAVMGATMADGGVNPITGEQVVSAEVTRASLAMMTIAGLYETSGDWLLDVGVPGKSGISGGIVASSPGKGGLGVFSPLLDAEGNSVRGQLAARFLADHLGLDLLGSVPQRSSVVR